MWAKIGAKRVSEWWGRVYSFRLVATANAGKTGR